MLTDLRDRPVDACCPSDLAGGPLTWRSQVLAFAEHQRGTQQALQAAAAAAGPPSDVTPATKAENGRRVGPKVPWVRQVATLTSRFLKNMSRDKGNVQGTPTHHDSRHTTCCMCISL
jgi:hypothetical protein